MNNRNNLKEIREAKMLGKAELARLAGVSPLTIDRIEKGMPCRIKTQRQIVLALGLKLSQRPRVFRDTLKPKWHQPEQRLNRIHGKDQSGAAGNRTPLKMHQFKRS